MVRSYARLAESSGQDIAFLMAETSRFKRALRVAGHNYLVNEKRTAYEKAAAARLAAMSKKPRG